MLGLESLRRKHLSAFIRYRSLRKMTNFLRVEAERLLRKSHVKGRPYLATIDVTSACNLHCPLCPTGARQPGRKTGLMSMAQFTAIVDALKSTLYLMNMYNWGEPLLHPRVYDMIRYAHINHIYTSVSSNFNIDFDEDTARRMIESGLDYLYLSIDGATQETYAQYRRGGNFNDVVRNMKVLLKTREQLGARRPFIEWRFLVFKHNEHDIASAYAMAAQMGVDKVGVEGGTTENMSDRKGAIDKSLLPSEKKYQTSYHLDDDFCDWLWRTVTINWDGSVSACCLSYAQADDFGQFDMDSFMEVWNNDKFRASRGLFDSDRGCEAGTLCDTCYKVANHRKTARAGGRGVLL